MKEILNVVIYTSYKEGIKETKSCIFYTDGSIKECSKQEGIAAITAIAKTKGIKTTDELRNMMNKDTFYTLSEKEFKERYNTFLPQKREEIISSDNSTVEDIISGYEIVTEENIDDNYNDSDTIDYYYENTEFEQSQEVIEKGNKVRSATGVKEIIVSGIIASTLICGSLALRRCSKIGQIKNPITTTIDSQDNNINDDTTTIRNNELYTDYTLVELLNVTDNDFQKGAMMNASSAITGFNKLFAQNYIESGHDIKAALSFDEIVALQQAYNNYSIDEIRTYFNGYEVDARKMSNDYKNASLQLMGAYVIESKENPVDMSILIDNSEGRDFYNKYHSMYIAAKYAEGEEQLRLVNQFYKTIREDFAITEEERTEGIAHSKSHSKLKDYQLSVAPMIAAAEMIFQNLDTDYTLNDLEVDFLNDIGLCNDADDKFERIETIMLSSYSDIKNPLFEQYRNAITTELINNNEYVIDDAHRELSNLRLFQQIVNHDPLWKHRNGIYKGVNLSNSSTSKTTTTTKSWTETTTSQKTITSTTTSIIPEKDKKEIDKQIEKENEAAKKQAEEEAEKERQREQQEEDNKSKEVVKEVEEENKKTQNDINNANKQIEENNKDTDKSNDKPVNKNDINNADIKNEYTDKNGNIDGSVKNITTNGSGANQELPDPNKTGKSFEANYMSTTVEPSIVAKPTTQTQGTSEGKIEIESNDNYQEYDENGNPVKVRKLVRVKGN